MVVEKKEAISLYLAHFSSGNFLCPHALMTHDDH